MRPWVAGLFVLGLILRLAHLATVRDSPFFVYLMLDPLMYDEWGQRIVEGEWLRDRPFFQDPLYAYGLALLYRLFGHSYSVVALVQSALGAAVGPMLYLAARRWLPESAARLGGLIAVVYLPSIYYDGIVLKTAPATFTVTCLLLLLSARRLTPLHWLGSGAVLGVAILLRGNLLACLPVLAGFAWLAEGGKRPRTRLLSVAALGLGVAVILLPVTLHNRIAGEWILTTSNAGQNLYIGNNPLNRAGEYQRLPFVDPNPKYEERDFLREAQRRGLGTSDARAVSRYWSHQALAWIAGNPGTWAKLMWAKLHAYWGAYEIPDNLDYNLYRTTAPVLRMPLPGFGLVAPLGLLGAAFAARRQGWPRWLVVLLAVYTVTVVSFFVLSRFRMAVMPALFVLAGLGGVELARRVRSAKQEGSWRPLAGAIVGLLLAVSFVNLPVRGPASQRSLRLARALGLPVREETFAMGRFNLGVSYAIQAKSAEDPAPLLDLAETELRRAFDQERGYAQIPEELGKVLARQGRNREAIEAYEAARTIESENYRFAHAIGLLERREGQRQRAVREFRAALALEPRHVASAIQLGEVLLELGDPAAAAEAFRHALSLAPDNPRARAGLSEALSVP